MNRWNEEVEEEERRCRLVNTCTSHQTSIVAFVGRTANTHTVSLRLYTYQAQQKHNPSIVSKWSVYLIAWSLCAVRSRRIKVIVADVAFVWTPPTYCCHHLKNLTKANFENLSVIFDFYAIKFGTQFRLIVNKFPGYCGNLIRCRDVIAWDINAIWSLILRIFIDVVFPRCLCDARTIKRRTSLQLSAAIAPTQRRSKISLDDAI